MLTCQFYSGDGNPPQNIPTEKISDTLNSKLGTLWVDIESPTDADYNMLASEFHLHPLVVEDLKQGDQRPRVVEYANGVYVIAHELLPSDDPNDLERACVERGAELQSFVGPNFIVTTHTKAARAVSDARKRWESGSEMQKQGPFFLLYLLLDCVVDDYYPAMDAYDERISYLEQLVMAPAEEEVHMLERRAKSSAPKKPLQTLLMVRRDLLQMRRYVAPLRDAVNVLLRRVEAMPDEGNNGGRERSRALFAYFQDIYDHTIRVVDTIDTYRDLLSGVLDAHLAVASNRLNEIVKVMTSVSIILMSWAGISGLYGMNFVNMPELHWRYGYPYAVGLMALIGILEWAYFRHRKWL